MIQTNQDVTDINELQNATGFNEEVPSMKDDKDQDSDEDEDEEDLEEDDLDEEDADDDTDYEILPSNESGLTTNNDSAGDTSEEA